ncbi:MAG: prenyltransferase/squalene oxidase repeat-containing protein, partial [Archangium sp.]
EGGIEFFRRNAEGWAFDGPPPDDIPVASELILPRLLAEAATVGIELPHKPFQSLSVLGNRRRELISRMKHRAGTAPIHSFEAWGTEPTPSVLDGSKGVGNSPAATAHWLRLRRATARGGSEDIQGAEEFLRSAAEATGMGLPGVVPTVWPIVRYEQSWSLLALFSTGLLEHPGLRDAVRPQLDDVHRAVRPEGYGMSDCFVCDGDITSTCLAMLEDAGYSMDGGLLKRYQLPDGQFITYAHELQPSVTTTAHGVMALATLGQDVSRQVRWLEEKRGGDGLWKTDKWHASWLYTTSQVMLALCRAGATEVVRPTVEALLQAQHPEGGWGMASTPTLLETAYAVHALYALRSHGLFGPGVKHALQRAARWMAAQPEVPPEPRAMLWTGKELYRPFRLDSIFERSAMLALELGRDSLSQ